MNPQQSFYYDPNQPTSGAVHRPTATHHFSQHQQQPFMFDPSASQSSATGGMAGQFGFDPQQQYMYDPLFNTARQIGGQFAEQQKQKFTDYLSSFNLKYYFAVDTKYVAKKLGVILFPFFHKDWTMKMAGGDKPLSPREDMNAPDLYIPLMAFITYILVAGFVFGVQKRFTPEQLGMLTTNALFYLLLENAIVFITKYALNISQSLNVWHALAYSAYKYVGMVVCLLLYLAGGMTVYYCALIYCIFTTVFFMLRSLKTFILDGISGYGSQDAGRKRKLYLLLSIIAFQSLIMWLLTSSVTSYMPGKYNIAKMAMSGIGLDAGKDMPMTADGETRYKKMTHDHSVHSHWFNCPCLSFALSLLAIAIVITILYRRFSIVRFFVKTTAIYGCIFLSSAICCFAAIPTYFFNMGAVAVMMVFGFLCSLWMDVEVEVRGKEKIARASGADQKPLVLISNHQSSIDLYVMAHVWPAKCAAMVKNSLKYMPFFNFAAWLSNTIFVNRYSREEAHKALDEAVEAMRNKKMKIWVFPEGTRHPGGGFGEFKKGAFNIAVQANFDIIPIVVSSYEPFYSKEKRYFMGNAKVIAQVMDPVSTKNLAREDVPALCDRVRQEMLSVYENISREASTKMEKLRKDKAS